MCQTNNSLSFLALLFHILIGKMYWKRGRDMSIDERKAVNPFKNVVHPSRVKAVLREGTIMREKNVDNSQTVDTVFSGEIVTIQQDRGYLWYQIKKKNGKVGWVPREVLYIPENEPTNRNQLTKKEIEGHIRWRKLDSKTDTLIWVDIDRQLTYVLKKNEGTESWLLERTIICSTGDNKSPTKTGIYKIKDGGEWFYSDYFNSGAMYWVPYSGSYLFHSVAMDKDRKITNDTLGKKSSAGCIRMSVNDSKWFYENSPEGSTVFVY